MAEYLIYFNQQWVPDYPAEDWPAISAASMEVIRELHDAGELVFAAGLGDDVAFAHADYAHDDDLDKRASAVGDGPYSATTEWIGGFTLVDVADDERARYWAQRIASGCRWPQEIRRFKPGSTRGEPSSAGQPNEFIIYFNQQWVPDYPEGDWPEIGESARDVVTEIQAAGELVYAHGLEEEVAFAHADYDHETRESIVSDGPYAETKEWIGGFTLVDVADEERARHWTRRIAMGCRWPQEVRTVGAGSMRG
jgi:hypothetical protein